MKKSVFLVGILAVMLSVSSCGLFNKNKKNDDDFYDFNKKETRKEKSESTKKKTDREKEYEVAKDGTYTKPAKVSSRFEEVEIVRGAIDYNAKYFIILGSFSQEANANKLVGRLAKQGFAPNILRSPSGMFRVSGFYFNVEVAEIRKKYPEYSDLWLLIKK